MVSFTKVSERISGTQLAMKKIIKQSAFPLALVACVVSSPVTAQAQVAITSVSPNCAPFGVATTVTIIGSGFSANYDVSFSSAMSPYRLVSSQTLVNYNT